MNGKDLVEAMSYVDEAYIMEAESKAKVIRFRWQPIAAMAACLGLVLIGWWNVRQTKTLSMAAMPELSGAPSFASYQEEALVEETAENDYAVMMTSLISEMTVQVLYVEDGMAVCVVTDSGTGGYPVGTQLRIALPEEEETREDRQEDQLLIYFQPDAELTETIQAVDAIPISTEEP